LTGKSVKAFEEAGLRKETTRVERSVTLGRNRRRSIGPRRNLRLYFPCFMFQPGLNDRYSRVYYYRSLEERR